MFRTHTLNIPIQLIHLVHAGKLHKALGIYLLLKASCNGHVVLSVEQRLSIMTALGIKTVRSFEKHLDKLIQLNWVGYDKNSRTYYVRSFKTLRKQNGFYLYRVAPFCVSKDSANITEFVQAAIICNEVVRKQRARKAKIIKEVGRSAFKKESAIQELITTKKITAYCGLSNELIGELLGVSKSQADRIKKRLIKIGYLKAKAKYNEVYSFQKPDFLFLNHLPSNRRYKLKERKRKGIKSYVVLERTYDEIINLMDFRNQKSIVRRLKSAKK